MDYSQDRLWGAVAEARRGSHGTSSAPVYRHFAGLGFKPGASVLDAGCGSGDGAKLMSELGLQVVGTDFSQGMIDAATKNIPSVKFLCASTESLPFDDDTFEGAVAVNSVHFCPRTMAALRELKRVVRPGGKVLVNSLGPREESDLAKFFETCVALAPRERKLESGFYDPIRLASVGVMDALMADVGFEGIYEHYEDYSIRAPDVASALSVLSNTALFRGVAELVGRKLVEDKVVALFETLRTPTGEVYIRSPARCVIGTVK